MGYGIEFYKTDGVSAATGYAIAAFGGTATSATSFRVYLDYGNALGNIVDDAALYLEVEDPDAAGTWLRDSDSIAALGHFLIRLNGGSVAAVSEAFIAETTAFVPFGGTGLPFFLPRIVSNKYRVVEIEVLAPIYTGATSSSTLNWRITADYGRVVFARSVGISNAVGDGIITGVGNRFHNEWIDAPVVTATGTPDDKVHVSRHSLTLRGDRVNREKTDDITCNQNDGASAALTSGQAYNLILARNLTTGAPTSFKGTKAASGAQVDPTVTAGYALIARVRVAYHVTASVINQSDITSLAFNGRFKATIGTGLTVVVGGGHAAIGTAYIRRPYTTTVAVTAGSTNRIWLVATGGFVVVTADDNPPSVGARWLWTATTDGSSVTALTDKRAGGYLEPNARRVFLQGSTLATDEAISALVAACAFGGPAQLDRVYGGVRLASSGATGSTRMALNLRSGASSTAIFQETATPESRLVVAAQAYVDDGNAWPGICAIPAGSTLELGIDAITASGTRAKDAWAEAIVYPMAS